MSMTAETRAALTRRLAQLQTGGASGPAGAAPVSLGCARLDQALPQGGFSRGAVHEVLGPDGPGDRRGDGAAMGFGTFLLGRLMQTDPALRPAVWCMNRRVQHRGGALPGQAYAPGLQAFGVPVQRLLFLYCNTDQDVLWAAEEAVRSAAAGAIIAELDRLKPIATRRLQLAAEASGATVLALCAGGIGGAGSFAESRWRLTAWPEAVSGGACWRASLLRCRGGAAGQDWILRWRPDGLQAAEAPAVIDDTPQPQPVRDSRA